ncbi:MAG: chromosomal replication initiator protein DnaA [Hydrogenothermus sp.]|nr:MAG: chromosomal replication initiator protein DnaA [Hydrogenothermus sp.]
MDIWGNIVSYIAPRLDKDSLKLLKGIKSIGLKNGVLELYAPDIVYKDWFEINFLEEVQTLASKIARQKIAVRVLSKEEEEIKQEKEVLTKEIPQEKKNIPVNLNPKFTFSNLIIGNCNKIAYKACIAIAENPGKIYNPLFIYGGVGLGKTHLLHATAHYMLSKNPDANVIYTTADAFMSELITYMQKGSILDFRRKYKNIDLLLIDDVQFLVGKERTQIEFYYIFNALHLVGKQVILSSDTPPSKLKGIQERLLSRFSSGLVVEVRQPDLDTKLRIINKKAKEMKIEIPHDVVLFIAKTVNTNIRQLEGSLTKLKAYSQIMERPITLDMAREVLSDILEDMKIEEFSIEKVQKEVANYFAVNLNELLGNSRKKKVVEARQIAMYLARYLTSKSLNEISKAFKKKDHTTVLNAIEKVEKRMEKDRKFKLTVEFLRDKILTS